MRKLHKQESLEDKKKAIIVKGSFLALVLLLTFFMHLYVKNRPISPPPIQQKPTVVTKNSPSVLGARTQDELMSALAKELTNIKGQLNVLLEGAQDQGEIIIQDTSEELQDKAFDVAYDTAVVPVITQIQNLPEDQQTQIKEAICK